MHELIGRLAGKAEQCALKLGAQPRGDRGAAILTKGREPRLGVGDAADQGEMRIGRGSGQHDGAPDAGLDKGRERRRSARDRNNREIDGEALGIAVEQKPRAHGQPVAAVARHDRCDEQSGGASVAGWVRHERSG